MIIREVNINDIDAWSEMRTALWPDTDDNHLSEITQYFNGQSIDIVQAYIAEFDGHIIGFIELNLRNFAEGSLNSKVPYIEGWYIKPEYQGKGFGKQLMLYAEKWAISKGFSELASDTEVTNEKSINMHKHMGFMETERIVCFLKKIKEYLEK